MTDEELTKYSGYHLLYELKMFWWLTGALSYMEGYLHDAVLEAWVVHLRNLILFFCHPKADSDDVIAKDFLDKPDRWSQTESTTLKAARIRANKELSHITEKRKYAGEKDKDWDVAGLFREIGDIAKKFVSQASETKLHSDVRQLLAVSPGTMVVVGGVSHSTATVSRPLVFSVDSIFDKDNRRNK